MADRCRHLLPPDACVFCQRDVLKQKLHVAAHHLIWVWYQYAGQNQDGRILLSHNCMSAGEDAGDWLASLGLAKDVGWDFELTPEGKAVMDDDGMREPSNV